MMFKKRGYIFAQNEELLKAYSNTETSKKELLELVQNSQYSMISRFKLSLNNRIHKNKKGDDLVYRLVVITGKL